LFGSKTFFFEGGDEVSWLEVDLGSVVCLL
jgi:hypothetical protein